MGKFLISLVLGIILFTALAWVTIGHAADLEFGIGAVNQPNGHSEGQHTRCINDGYGLDILVGYPLSYDFHKLVGIQLDPGILSTYRNYETAHRLTSRGKESDQRREHTWTLQGIVRPGIRIWEVKAFGIFGAGSDLMQSEGLDIGYSIGAGFYVPLSETWGFQYSSRKFYRLDGGTYQSQAGMITVTW